MPVDKQLLERIRNNDPTLTSLSLYGNKIGDAGVKDLVDALKDNRTLTSLDLRWNEIGDAGAKDLADALKDGDRIHGAIKGWALTFKRLARCHPWGTHGYDPVPKNEKHSHS